MTQSLGGAETAIELRRDADKIGGALPPLLAEAEHLAAALLMGTHGRRRAGHGENFWQYRQAIPGDVRAAIDWRRSGRSDIQFIREMEWETAQSVHFWVDRARSMSFRGPDSPRSKVARASLLALALAVLLIKGGERVGLMDSNLARPRSGRAHLASLALELVKPEHAVPDYATPPEPQLARGARAVFLSDFFSDPEAMAHSFRAAADQGARGCIVQVLDDTEMSFPFDGRIRFESMGGIERFEAQRARNLRKDYIAKLEERREFLSALASQLGWRYHCHTTSQSPRGALLWLYMALEAGR